jgi:predicted flap endonuclease-1-like 5' DNA nuclease
MDFLSNLWQKEPTGLLMIIGLSAFLIGLIIGYLLSIRSKKELSAARQQSDSKWHSLQQNHEAALNQLKLLQADFRKASFETAEAKALANRLEQEIRDKDDNLKILASELKRVSADNASMIDKLSNLKISTPQPVPGEASSISATMSRLESMMAQLLRYEEPVPTPTSTEDPGLLIIEGMSPEAAERLNSAGITTMQHLADTSPDTLRIILQHSELSQVMASWPTQARLALEGQWDLLRDFQHRLKGGKVSDQ